MKQEFTSDFIKFSPKALLQDGASVNLEYEAQRDNAGKYSLYDITIHGLPGKDLNIARLELFSLDLCSHSAEVFRQGFFMPSDPTGFYVIKAGEPAPRAGGWKPDCFGPNEFTSHTMAAFRIPGWRNVALIGCVFFERFQSYVIFEAQKKSVALKFVYLLDSVSLARNQHFCLERIMLGNFQDLNVALESYAEYVGKKHGARIPRKTVTGWVDWQYYRESKNEKEIMRSANAMQKLKRRGFPLEYIIIDGGWCGHASEWLSPCKKFPSGMKKLSRILQKKGFKLGLWLAPYITNVKTKVALKHPEWMVLDEKTDKPLYKNRSNVGPCYVLDFTVPEALNWLGKIVRTMVKDWGIAYIKLDGPNLSHYRGGRFHNPGLTALEQARRSLETIRAECGENVIVEGEGLYGPAIGLVDTQRTTADTYPWWYYPETGIPSMKENMKNDLLSAFLHNRFWHNHRENVILRDFPSPFHARSLTNPQSKDIILPENELCLQISAAAMSGGAMLLTDPMEELCRNPDKIELISKFLPHYEFKSACLPLDVFMNGKQPSIYALKIDRDYETWHIVGVFNWEDSYRNFKIPLSGIAPGGVWHGFDFWNERYLGCFSKTMQINDVPAHGCRIIALRAAQNHPKLLGTNMHIFQGAIDIKTACYKGNRLHIEANHFYQKDRKVFVSRPKGFCLKETKTNATDFLVDERNQNFCIINFNGRRRTCFDLIYHENRHNHRI